MSWNVRTIVNDELENNWKNVDVTCFKILSEHLLAGAKENPENP
jgi:hypothetical protein